MTSKFWQREMYVIRYGQSNKFRIIKWIILIVASILLYLARGGQVLGIAWIILSVLGISVHFFFRYKTHGWRQVMWRADTKYSNFCYTTLMANEENPLEKRESAILPSFLYENEGRIYTGSLGESEITWEYKKFIEEYHLNSKSLPSFLYERGGEIHMGAPDDSDVTEAWQRWVKESQ